jgi:hypothetical protein
VKRPVITAAEMIRRLIRTDTGSVCHPSPEGGVVGANPSPRCRYAQADLALES